MIVFYAKAVTCRALFCFGKGNSLPYELTFREQFRAIRKKHPVFSSFSSVDFQILSPDEYRNAGTTAYILRIPLLCPEGFLKLGRSTDTRMAGVCFSISVDAGLVAPVTLLVTTRVFKANHGGFEERFFIYVTRFSA